MYRRVVFSLALLCCVQNLASGFDLLALYPDMDMQYMGILDLKSGPVIAPDPDSLSQGRAFLYLVKDGGQITFKVEEGEPIQICFRREGSLDYIIVMDDWEAAEHKDLRPLEMSGDNMFKYTLTNDLAFVMFPGDIAEKFVLKYQDSECDLESLPEYVDKDKTECRSASPPGSGLISCEVQCLRNYKLVAESNIKCSNGKFYPSRPCDLMPWHVKMCATNHKCVYDPEELERYNERDSSERLTESELETLVADQILPAYSETIPEEDVGGTSLAVSKKSKTPSCRRYFCPSTFKCHGRQREDFCYACKRTWCSGRVSYN